MISAPTTTLNGSELGRIEVDDLVVIRGGRTVLDRVDLAAGRGVTVGIIGPNGAGKSSLLLALYRAIDHSSGSIMIEGDPITSLRRREIARRVAVVAQEVEQSLPLPVRDAVGLGRLARRGLIGYGDDEDREQVEAALARVGLSHLADRLVNELSGGERQRVLIARAMAQDAGYLLLDEPTNHLDLHHQFALLDLVRTIHATTVVVLHDLNLAARACDELVLLQEGRLVASGPCDEVLEPALISSVYRVDVLAIERGGRRHLVFEAASH